MDSSETSAQRRVRLIQQLSGPIVHGRGTGEVRCGGCDNLLVAAFGEGDLIGLDVECARCGAVSATPPWPPGAPLPQGLVVFSNPAGYPVDETVDLRGKAAGLISQAEMDRVQRSTRIGPPQPFELEFSESGLTKLETHFSGLFKTFPKGLTRTRHAMARGNLRFFDCMPAWAIARLQRCVAGSIELHSDEGVAVNYLKAMLHILPRWEHHERFPAICDALCAEFHHSMAMLFAATYLADLGNAIGFAEQPKGGGRSPDLFISFNVMTKHAIEVKAPKELQWPNTAPDDSRFTRLLEGKLRETRGQIVTNGGGLLVLGSSCGRLADWYRTEQLTKDFAAQRRIPARVSGVVLVWFEPLPGFMSQEGKVVQLATGMHISLVKNPTYTGPGHLNA